MARRPRRLSSPEVERLVHEAYAVHYIFMSLGFDAGDIFAGAANVANGDPPGLCATVELHAQGKTFIYTLLGLLPGDEVRFMRVWTEFAAGQPTRDRKELDDIVHRSQAWKMKGTILGALADKGFFFPAVGEEAASSKQQAASFGGRGKEHVH